MVLAAKIKQPDAQSLIVYLKEHDLFNSRFKSQTKKGFLYFAVKQEFKLRDVTFEEVADDFFELAKQRMTLREALRDKLTEEELSEFKSAFDQVGSIAILEIDEQLRHKEKVIGETLLELNSAIKTVLRKDGKHRGTFRNQPMKLISGVDTREATFIENGVRMFVDVEKVYFSSRLANERVRIADQISDTEDVLVMFSGAAPQALVIEKRANPKSITGIEINPAGHECGLKSMKLNKFKKTKLICGDVHEVSRKLDVKYDRIIMNLPKTAHEFLGDAVRLLKPNGILHYYDFLHEDEFALAEDRVSAAAAKQNRKVEFSGIYTVGSQGIKTYRICLDVKIF